MTHPLTKFKLQKKLGKTATDYATSETPIKGSAHKKKKVVKKKTKKKCPIKPAEPESSLPMVILESSIFKGDCSAVTSVCYDGTDESVALDYSPEPSSTSESKTKRTNSKMKSESCETSASASPKSPGRTESEKPMDSGEQDFKNKSTTKLSPPFLKRKKVKEQTDTPPSSGNEAGTSERAIVDDFLVRFSANKQKDQARSPIPFESVPFPDDSAHKNGSDVSSLSDAASYESREVFAG
eukprot:scaffold39823_cov145-Amphora_coffeaeformis.AAC.1